MEPTTMPTTLQPVLTFWESPWAFLMYGHGIGLMMSLCIYIVFVKTGAFLRGMLGKA